jgi:hypothetical protein
MAEKGLKRGKGNWRTKPHLAGVPFPFVLGGVALSVYLSQKMGRSPNLKNKK